jgi:HD-like signal output (HDOD) protein
LPIVHADYSIYRQVIAQLMSGQEQLPSLPTITLDIRRALECPNVSLLSLSKVIAKDPSLSALLLKYASSSQFHHHVAPQSLIDVVKVLGLQQVERITMLHSVKSLFTLNSVQHKRLFVETWNRLVLKVCISTFLAKHISRIPADHVLLGSLLSEIGTLAVLSVFKSQNTIPCVDTYVALCREYSKSLGVIMLKKWQVNDEYIRVIRKTGEWFDGEADAMSLEDVVNLGLFHSLKMRHATKSLPLLTELAAYKKLTAPHNRLTPHGSLSIVISRQAEIRVLAQSLFKVTPR